MTRRTARITIGAFLGAALGAVAISGGAQQSPTPASAPNPGAARFTGKQTMLESGGSETLRSPGRFEAGNALLTGTARQRALIFVRRGARTVSTAR